MLFKYSYLAPEYALLHRKVTEAADALDAFLRAEGLPDMMVTHVFRTAGQQEDFYWKQYINDFHGVEAEARKLARNKFSWHRVYCAMDIRNNCYDRQAKERIFKFLKKGRESSQWEILLHDIGRGDHFHVGYRDYAARRKWEQQLKA